ncbi:hypothetical protein J4Q44_G00366680 [Coregonus suidteri]|uniref:E3 ubiquitin/ISG15 ligase TRIM25-like n=1 Tax=Coregonus suidteri TaxID=861788 RepID=A0AAN8QKS2_9TELE
MAAAMDSIRCSICLNLLKDPVTIPCGHSYCMGCIKDSWDQDDVKGVLISCPQCRQTFIPRPVLKKSTMLAELVENLKKAGLQDATPAHCYAGPGDVACDFCTERKLKAVKSCLVCLVSYCETHLQPHYESPAFKKHKLVKASIQPEEKICSRHDKLLEMYCRTDQQFICLLCVVGEHKGHDTVSSESEMTERKSQLGEKQQKSKQRIQTREKEIQEVGEAVKSLKSFQSLCVSPGSEALPRITVNQHISFEDVKSVTGLKSQVENICSEEIAKISVQVTKVHIVPPSEPHYPPSFGRTQSVLSVGGLPSRRNDTTCQETRPEPKTREEFLECE